MIARSEWLGPLSFDEALVEQARRFDEVHALASSEGSAHDGYLLGLEHPSVITLGRRSDAAMDLVAGFADLPIRATDRGGQATLHSLGQLVIYPILPLRRWSFGPRTYVEALLETTAAVLRRHGIAAEARFGNAGVYTAKGKIAFCGVRVDHGISRHGLAINISNDLSLFRAIRPCGMEAPLLTSWAHERGPLPSTEFVFTEWAREWALRTEFTAAERGPTAGKTVTKDRQLAPENVNTPVRTGV